MTSINNSIIMALVAAYQAAKSARGVFALSGWEIDQFECWGSSTPKVLVYMAMQEFILQQSIKPLRAAIEARVGGGFLVIGGKIVLL